MFSASTRQLPFGPMPPGLPPHEAPVRCHAFFMPCVSFSRQPTELLFILSLTTELGYKMYISQNVIYTFYILHDFSTIVYHCASYVCDAFLSVSRFLQTTICFPSLLLFVCHAVCIHSNLVFPNKIAPYKGIIKCTIGNSFLICIR